MPEHPMAQTGAPVLGGELPDAEELADRVPRGRITAVVGPGACGKSALLRGMARVLDPAGEAACLDGARIRDLPAWQLAQDMGLPGQPSAVSAEITVSELLGHCRTRCDGGSGRWDQGNDEAVDAAMRATGTRELADRPVGELSGGQRQRVWIAVALARRTGALLLDEPTTYLDMARQIQVLDLLVDVNRDEGTTVVLALHDLNLACRYADRLLVVKDGALVAEGAPADVVTESLVRSVFELPCRIVADPVSATPMIVPVGRHHSGAAAGEEDRAAAGGTASGSGGTGGAAAGSGAGSGGESESGSGSGPDGGVPAAGERVSSESELRAVVEPPADVIRDKAVVGVDAQSRRFLAASPFFLLATAADDGTVDVSPRGDPPGSVLVLDGGRALAFADRGGNRRVDSMRNILRSPRVGMLFVVPNVEHTLRVNGRARIVRDGELLDRLARGRTRPDLATVVEVEELFVHCGRAFARSSLWDPATWPERGDLPTAGTLFKSQATLPKADTA